MKTINEVRLVARLGKDAEMKQFSNGGSICKLVACTELSWKDKATDEWRKEAEWHTIVVKGAKAKDAGKLRKGQLIDVAGRLKTRAFEVNGEKRYTTEVVTWEVKAADDQQPAREAEPNGNRVDDFNF